MQPEVFVLMTEFPINPVPAEHEFEHEYDFLEWSWLDYLRQEGGTRIPGPLRVFETDQVHRPGSRMLGISGPACPPDR